MDVEVMEEVADARAGQSHNLSRRAAALATRSRGLQAPYPRALSRERELSTLKRTSSPIAIRPPRPRRHRAAGARARTPIGLYVREKLLATRARVHEVTPNARYLRRQEYYTQRAAATRPCANQRAVPADRALRVPSSSARTHSAARLSLCSA